MAANIKLPETESEWMDTPRPVSLPPDATDLRIASTYALLPCPFCGNRSVNVRGTINRQTSIIGYYVECANYRCMASTFSNAMTREEARDSAIARWEKRNAKATRHE